MSRPTIVSIASSGEPLDPVDTTSHAGGVGRRATSGVLWMTAQKWVVRASGLVSIALLTRLLEPEDFGLLAAAVSVMTLVYVLSDLGFSTYIVQAETVDRRTLSTAFWFSIVLGVVLGGAIFLGAPLLADVLRLPEVVPILRTMTLSVLFISVTAVPLALLRRRMAFRVLALQEISAAGLAQVVAVVAAVVGLGVWALVLQLMVAQVVTATFVWIAARWLPSRHVARDELASMARFGVQVVGNGLVSVVRTWAETAIIVTGLGVRELGYLNIAQRLVQAAQDVSVSALLPVATVAFSQVRSSADRLRAAYLRASSITHALVTPLMVFLAVSSPVLVPVVFGSGWSSSAPLVRPLAIAAILTLGVTIDLGLHYGLGRPGRWLAFTVVIYALAVAVTAFAVRYGVLGIVTAFVGTALVETVGRWFLVGRLIDMRPVRVAVPFLSILAPAALSAAAGLGVLRVLDGRSPLVVLAVTGLVILAVHGVAVRLLLPATLADLATFVPARLSRRNRSRTEVPS